MKRLNNKKGFTLIELIIVIAILAILALILIPALQRYLEEANVKRDITNARQLYTEVVLEFASGNPSVPGVNLSATGNQNLTVTGLEGLVCTYVGNVVTRTVTTFVCDSPAFDNYGGPKPASQGWTTTGEYEVRESDINPTTP